MRAASSAKHSMKAWPILLRFSCGSVTPAKAAKNLSSRVDHVQVGLEVVGELPDHRLRFVLAQQAVVDQDAGGLRADGLGQQGRHHRGIDPAGKPADHPPAGPRGCGWSRCVSRAKSPSFQVPSQPHTARRKFPRIFVAQRRVGHLGMKLQAVDRQAAVLHRGVRAGVGGRQRQEIVRHLRSPGRRGSSTPGSLPAGRPTGRSGPH